jgi:glycosyltransferase involved in cell wall biosynthesis
MAMPTSMPRPCFFIVSTSETPCGVEDFARKMAAALRQNEPDGGYDILPVSARWSELPRALREMAKADRIVFSLPLVAWKRTIALSWVLVLCAFFRRQKIFVYLHEWSSLHPLRRLVFIPFVLLSKTIIFLSPYIRSQFTADRWVRWASGKSILALHAPTIRRPESRRVTEIVSRVKKLKRDKSIVIGQFGAIYKGKGTDALLDVCAYLCGQNVDASVVFVGGMTKSLDGYGDEFLNKVNTLKLENRVIVTGYVDNDEELFAIFDLIDVFLYIFPEGLTARRSSVLASLQAGRPVVVSEPTVAGEFSHHEGYTSLVENGAIVFFPSSATVEDLAGTVMSVARQPSKASTLIDYDAWWKRAAQKAAEMLEGRTR